MHHLVFLFVLFSSCAARLHFKREHSLNNNTQPQPSHDYTARCGATDSVPYLPRRQTKTSLPEAIVEDKCDGIETLAERLLITTTYEQSVDWMNREISVPFFVYYAGGILETHKHPNAGSEAAGYLTFIAEYYSCLPEVMLFAHPHKESYHSYRPLNEAIDLLQWKNVPGYASLHPTGASWSEFNTSDPISNLIKIEQNKLEPFDEIPCNQIFNQTQYEYWSSWEYRRSQYLSKAFDSFFSHTEIGEKPERMRMTLVAEFLVRKNRVQKRSRRFYLQCLKWMEDAIENENFSSWEVGVVFELLWHYIFGEKAFLTKSTLAPCDLYFCGKIGTF